MFRFLFKIPQHKTFSHTPIYFEPDKEDLKQRVARIEGEGDVDAHTITRGSLKERWSRGSRNAASNKTSNIRLLVIILILFLVAWLLFY